MNQHKELILKVMQEQRGDDLYRAEQAFKYCSPEQMQQEFGESGQTRSSILEAYRKRHDDFTDAIEWVTRLPD